MGVMLQELWVAYNQIEKLRGGCDVTGAVGVI